MREKTDSGTRNTKETLIEHSSHQQVQRPISYSMSSATKPSSFHPPPVLLPRSNRVRRCAQPDPTQEWLDTMGPFSLPPDVKSDDLSKFDAICRVQMFHLEVGSYISVLHWKLILATLGYRRQSGICRSRFVLALSYGHPAPCQYHWSSSVLLR